VAVQLNIVGNFDDKELKRAQAALTKLSDGAKSSGASMASAFTGVGEKMQGVGRGLTAGVTLPLVGVGVIATNWASDAAESANKVDTVFANNAKQIHAWSKGAATSFGLSKGQAEDFFGSVGTMLQGFGLDSKILPGMSKDVMGLAADLGSFHNLDTAEVLDMISSSFRGEFDSIQRVIPSINGASVEQEALAKSGKKSAKQLTDQEKAMATYSLLMKGAGPATGDFAKTQDGAANATKIAQAQMRTAGETIGKVFLPIVAKVAKMVAKVTDWFGKLSPKTQKLGVIFAVAAAAAGPIIGFLGTLATVIGFVLSPVGAVVAAVVALGAVFVLLYKKNAGFRSWVQGVVSAVRDGLAKAFAYLKDVVLPAVLQAFNTFKTQVLPQLVGAFMTAKAALVPVLQAMGAYVSAVISTIIRVARALIPVWVGVFKYVANFFRAIWTPLGGFIRGILQVITGIFQVFSNMLRGNWSAAFGGLKNVVVGAFNTVKGLISTAIAAIGRLFSGVGGVIGRALSSVASAMTAPFRSGAAAIRNVWNSTIGGKGITIPDIPGLPGRGRRFEIPRLHKGGIVPGRKGSEVPAILQAGERVLSIKQVGELGRKPTTGGAVIYNISVDAGINDPSEVGRRVVDTIRSYERLNGSGWRAA